MKTIGVIQTIYFLQTGLLEKESGIVSMISLLWTVPQQQTSMDKARYFVTSFLDDKRLKKNSDLPASVHRVVDETC